MRILYVEDNPTNLLLVQRVARSHNVISYIDGEEALANFEKDNPDLILMDVQLAGKLTGLDVVRKLRSDGYTGPIIAVTAYAMVGDKERCLEAGCDDYIAKPLPIPRLVTLFAEIEEQLKAKASTEETTESPAPEKPVLEPAPADEKDVSTQEAPSAPEAQKDAPPAEEETTPTPVAKESVPSTEPKEPASSTEPAKDTDSAKLLSSEESLLTISDDKPVGVESKDTAEAEIPRSGEKKETSSDAEKTGPVEAKQGDMKKSEADKDSLPMAVLLPQPTFEQDEPSKPEKKKKEECEN